MKRLWPLALLVAAIAAFHVEPANATLALYQQRPHETLGHMFGRLFSSETRTTIAPVSLPAGIPNTTFAFPAGGPFTKQPLLATLPNNTNTQVVGCSPNGDGTCSLDVAITSGGGGGGGGGGTGGGANGSAGSAGSTAQYIQGIAGGVPIPITGTINAVSAATYNNTTQNFTNGTSNPLQANNAGSLETQLCVNQANCATVGQPSLDALFTSAYGLLAINVPYAFNGSTLDRVRSANAIQTAAPTGLAATGICNAYSATNLCAAVAPTIGDGVNNNTAALQTNAVLMAASNGNGGLNRIFAVPSNGDSLAGASGNALQVASLGFAYNGTTFDRLRSATAYNSSETTGTAATALCGYDSTLNASLCATLLTANADTVAPGGTVLQGVEGFNYAYNGASFDRMRSVQGINGVAQPGLNATGICNASNATTTCATVANGALLVGLGSTPQPVAINGAGTGAGNPLFVSGGGGVYNSTPPTTTNGQYVPFQTDINGNLKVAGTFSATTSYPYNTSNGGQTATNGSAVATGGIFNSSITQATTGQYVVQEMTPGGQEQVALCNSSGQCQNVTVAGGNGSTLGTAQFAALTGSLPYIWGGSANGGYQIQYGAQAIASPAPFGLGATAICNGASATGACAAVANGALLVGLGSTPQPVAINGVGTTAGNPLFVSGGTGGGANGSAGSAGSTAQYIQGIAGGVPVPITGTINAVSAATYNNTTQNFTNGTSNPLQANNAGSLETQLCVNQANCATVGQPNLDALSTSAYGLLAIGVQYGYNGASLDRVRTANAYQTAAPTGLAAVGICNASTATASCANVTGGALLTTQGATPQPVSGTVTANAGSGYPTPLAVQPVSGTVTVNTPAPTTAVTLNTGTNTIGSIANTAFGITGAIPTGSNTIGNVGINGTVPVSGTFFQATQPVSIAGTVTTSPVYPYSLATGAQTGTAASGVGAIGQYNSTALTLTNGQVAALQEDANGYLNVDIKAGGSGGGGSTGSVTAAGTNGTLAQAVQGINGGVALPVTGTFAQPYSMSAGGQTATAGSGVGTLGVYNSAAPNFTNGQVAPLQINPAGELETQICVNQVNCATVGQPSIDGLSASAYGLLAISVPYAFNGSTLDRLREGTAGSAITAGTAGVQYVQGTGPAGTVPAASAAVTGLGATRYAVFANTAATVQAICAVACTAYDISAINTTAAACYIQEFNTAAASVTLGTTAPVRVVLTAAGAQTADSIPPTIGAKFTTAWSYATTTTPTGATACGSTVYVQADSI